MAASPFRMMAFAAGLGLAAAAMAQPTSAYLEAAGSGDLYEKEASKLVLQSSKDAKIREFATMMVADHTKSTNMVKAAAAKDKVGVPPAKLQAKQLKMISDLRVAQGAARDQVYVDQQKKAHAEALAAHKDYAATGDKASLKGTAGQIVPVVEHHIMMLNGMPAKSI